MEPHRSVKSAKVREGCGLSYISGRMDECKNKESKLAAGGHTVYGLGYYIT